jgi:hypothetical protein
LTPGMAPPIFSPVLSPGFSSFVMSESSAMRPSGD